MGNSNVFKNSKSTFIEQLKVDSRSEMKVIGIYINPTEFPNSGLIIVTNKCNINKIFYLDSRAQLFACQWYPLM